MELDPLDQPPALSRELPPLPEPAATPSVERILVSLGIVVAIAFLSLPILGSQAALSVALLASPVVLGLMMRRHATPGLLATGAALGLPLALGVLWLT